MKEQLFFDDMLVAGKGSSANSSAPGRSKPAKVSRNAALQIRQAILGWLLTKKPTGFGINVATRISRYRADIAAFWSRPKNRLLTPVQTMIIEIRHGREACWPDCADRDKLLELLRAAKKAKAELEEQIRQDEPHLADDNLLFSEFCDWNYHQSANRHYHASCRQVEKIEHAIYHGSRFEMIRSAQVADILYLAVPENSIKPTEVADGWGLLYFDEQQHITEILHPQNWHCTSDKRHHLLQNIAAANSRSVLFQNGISKVDDRIIFTKAPRRRRK